MRIPWWKSWWSHLTPILLEQTGSEQNPELSVLLYKGRLQLLSGNAIYSWDDLYRNFTVALGRLSLDRRPEADVLLLGLGLGSIPFILEKVYGRRYHYTVVEWDETVAYLAGKYTLSRLDSPVEVITADAGVFIEVCEEFFDFVIVDIFEDDLTPPPFEEPEFLRACAARLKPGGLLLFNRLHGAAKDKVATNRFYERIFRRVFPDAWYIDTRGNWILCHRKI
jgi:spermidine synthase